MTSKEVSIKLVSRQSDGNTKEETELISAGLYEATEKDIAYRMRSLRQQDLKEALQRWKSKAAAR